MRGTRLLKRGAEACRPLEAREVSLPDARPSDLRAPDATAPEAWAPGETGSSSATAWEPRPSGRPRLASVASGSSESTKSEP